MRSAFHQCNHEASGTGEIAFDRFRENVNEEADDQMPVALAFAPSLPR